MRFQSIPNTDLKVSSICLGTMTFGTPVTELEAIEITHWAVDHGINFIDTANMYEGYTRCIGSAGGVAEEILGKALKGKRDQVVLATKVGMKIGPSDSDEGLSRKHVFREVDRSLTRLQCETIDIYYMHKPDPKTPLAESVQAFNDLVEMGKIRYWGVSNFSSLQISEVLHVCDGNGWRRPVMIQSPYSLLKRQIEADILPLCEKEKIAVASYQVLQGGLLTGKYRQGEPLPPDSRQVEKPEWTMVLDEAMFTRLEQIQDEAQENGRTLLEHALQSLLEQPVVVSLIVGIKRVAQLRALIASVD